MKRKIIESMSIEEAFRALNVKNAKSKSLHEDYNSSTNAWAKNIVNAENHIISSMTNELSDHRNVPVACEYSSWNNPSFVKRMLSNETFTFTADNIDEMCELVVDKIATAYETWLKSPEIVARSQRALSDEEFNIAQDWYNDTGDADNDNWPDNLLNNDPDYLERVNSWWEDNRSIYMDEDDYEDSYEYDDANNRHNFTTIAEIVPFADFISGKTAIYFLKDFAGYTAELYIGVHDGAIYGVDPGNETADYICEVSDINSYNDLALKANFDSDANLYGEKGVLITTFKYDDLTWGEFIQKYEV